MRWPWVSRRQHEADLDFTVEIMRARIGELERAIREHLTTDAGHSRLRAVLNANDRREREARSWGKTAQRLGGKHHERGQEWA